MNTRNLLLRSLSDELSEKERQQLEELLREDAGARTEYQGMMRLQEVVADAGHRSFGPSFADRVIERIGRGGESRRFDLSDALASFFSRLAPVAVAVALGLGIYNIAESGADQSPLEAALGLGPVTVEAAYDAEFTDMMLSH